MTLTLFGLGIFGADKVRGDSALKSIIFFKNMFWPKIKKFQLVDIVQEHFTRCSQHFTRYSRSPGTPNRFRKVKRREGKSQIKALWEKFVLTCSGQNYIA